MTDPDLGTLERHGEGATLRFTRRYPHPPEKVWRAVTEPEHMRVWFPHQVLGAREAGARLRFVTSVDPDEGFTGEMLQYDPPKVVEMMWGPSRLRIELHPDADGTRLVLTESLDDIGTAARNGAGWHECLDRLEAVVAGTTPPRWGEPYREVHPRYCEALGSEATRQGPPEGWDADLPDDPYAPKAPFHDDPLPAP